MNALYITSASYIFYYLEFSETFFFPSLFYSNINYMERNINYLFVCPHPISGVFGAAAKGHLTISRMITYTEMS